VSEPDFLTLNEVLQIHAHGGMEGVRDPGLVESALASARNTFHYARGDVFDVAASYAFHLAQSQAFIDGNKRTAAASALVFLARNGVYVRPPKWELYLAMIQIAERKLDKPGLTRLFRSLAEK
jgi:death-on-curing protein